MSSEDHVVTSIGLRHYVRVVARHWLVVATCTVIGGLASIAYLTLAPKQVSASTRVAPSVITTTPFDPDRAASRILDPAREGEIAGSSAVIRRAAATLPGVGPDEVRQATTVKAASEGAVVTVSFTAPSAAEATRGADAVARAYLKHRSWLADQKAQRIAGEMTPRIRTLGKQLTAAEKVIANAPATSQKRADAVSLRTRTEIQLNDLYSDRNDVLSVDTNGGEVLASAAEGPLVRQPRALLAVATGLGVGAVAGLVAVFVRHRLDRWVRSRSDVEDALGAPVLVSAPAEMAVPADGNDLFAVAREYVADALGPGASTLAVIDVSESDDAPGVAAGLAMAVRDTGRPVRLVLSRAADPSFVEAMTDRGDHGSVDLVTPEPGAPQGILDATAREGLEITTPGVLVLAAAAATDPQSTQLELIRRADAVLVVAELRDTRPERVRAVRDRARSLDTPLIGAVLIGAASRSSG